uniref:SMP-30/Gluconolactonase/LRE-like region domain-containing protein n=1 Tax=Odontella aurita TaxID=265563 RepID=A0A7S4NFI5_9STRA
MYFTEEGGRDAGVHARDKRGRYYTILESPVYQDETTGLAFSPDGKHMYVAYQKNGILFDLWREDGLPFHGLTLNVKYHHDYGEVGGGNAGDGGGGSGRDDEEWGVQRQ